MPLLGLNTAQNGCKVTVQSPDMVRNRKWKIVGNRLVHKRFETKGGTLTDVKRKILSSILWRHMRCSAIICGWLFVANTLSLIGAPFHGRRHRHTFNWLYCQTVAEIQLQVLHRRFHSFVSRLRIHRLSGFKEFVSVRAKHLVDKVLSKICCSLPCVHVGSFVVDGACTVVVRHCQWCTLFECSN